jgi:hypothetical protein
MRRTAMPWEVFVTRFQEAFEQLRLARNKTVAAANRYLRERFVPDYNACFSVPGAEPGSAKPQRGYPP